MRYNRKYKVLLYSYSMSEAEISHMSQKIQQRDVVRRFKLDIYIFHCSLYSYLHRPHSSEGRW